VDSAAPYPTFIEVQRFATVSKYRIHRRSVHLWMMLSGFGERFAIASRCALAEDGHKVTTRFGLVFFQTGRARKQKQRACEHWTVRPACLPCRRIRQETEAWFWRAFGQGTPNASSFGAWDGLTKQSGMLYSITWYLSKHRGSQGSRFQLRWLGRHPLVV